MGETAIKTPTLIQMEVTECGAVCLGIILQHYGLHLPVAELRSTCGVSRDGCSAFHIIEAAKHYGLEAEGYRLKASEVLQLQKPSILFWENKHFVVLERQKGAWYYINDPATGRRCVSTLDFTRCFSGVALELKPGRDFKKSGKAKGVIKPVLERAHDVYSIVGFLFIIQLSLLLVGLSSPVFSRIFIDNVLAQRQIDWVVPLIYAMSLAASIVALGSFLQGYVRNRLQAKLSLIFSSKFLWHTLRLPVLFFFQRFGGEIISRIRLNTKVSQALTGQLSVTVMNVLLILFYGLVMFQYDVMITLLGILTAGLSVISVFLMGEVRRSAYARVQQEQAQYTGQSIDAIKNIENIKTTGCESFFLQRLSHLQVRLINAFQVIGIRDAFLGATLAALHSGANLSLLAVGCYRVMHGNLTIGMFIAFQMLMSSFLTPFSQLTGLSMQLQTLKLDLARLNDVLDNPLDAGFCRSPSKAEPISCAPALELQGVSYGYCLVDDPVVRDISLRVDSGCQLAVVGASGAGKSTIRSLVAGLFSPWEGRILYCGLPIEAYSREEFSCLVAMVSQELFLFEGTVWDNLTLWNPEADEAEVIKAIRAACIEDEILQREGGLHSRLIEGGHNLSQGQRQRLEIARALAVSPRVLILDEATSALDVETESQVMDNIRELSCASLIITHRLSTIRACDQIVVLEGGSIVDSGTHEELVKRKGLYRNLLDKESFL